MDTENPQETPDEQASAAEPIAARAETAEDAADAHGAADAATHADEPPATPDASSASASANSDDDDDDETTAKLPTTVPLASRHLDTLEPQATGVGEPLTVGAVVAGYRIVAEAPADERGARFLAESVEGARDEEDIPGLRYVVREAQGGASDQLAHLVAMELRHPVLLTPVALAREGGRLYLVSVEITDAEGAVVPTMNDGERLRPVDALRAGIELADALAAMHRNGLAHLHISPSSVTLYEGRIFLTGVEEATITGADAEESQPLFARDVNFLARTMGLIGGVVDTPALDEESSAQRSLREIALRGEAGSFTRADELAESFALALQAMVSAGAEMGADLRVVRLAVTADAATTVGHVRAANQDAYGIAVFDVHDDAAADAPVGVFLVADGMGGEAHGEIASRLVARAVTAEMTRQFTVPTTLWPALAVFDPVDAVSAAPKLALAQALEAAVKEANRQTRAFSKRLKATTGSTVTALALAGARAAIAHLGDSRAYLLRDNQLLQLTEDHSLLARMEAMQHPMLEDPSFVVPRSVLYRSVGQDDDVTPDLMEFVVAPGDRIVLCSDGLWDELAPEVIGVTMAEASSPRACAAELVSLANKAGGNDNSTAVVLFIEAEPEDDAALLREPPLASRATQAPDGVSDQPATSPAGTPDAADVTDGADGADVTDAAGSADAANPPEKSDSPSANTVN